MASISTMARNILTSIHEHWFSSYDVDLDAHEEEQPAAEIPYPEGSLEYKRHMLAQFVAAIEMDPMDMKNWLYRLGGITADDQEPREVTLREVMSLSDTRKMRNVMQHGGTIGMKVIMYYLAFTTQSGKTNGAIMFNLWREESCSR